MKTMNHVAAIGLTSAMLALDAVAAQPGRPDAFTRGIDMTRIEHADAARAKCPDRKPISGLSGASGG